MGSATACVEGPVVGVIASKAFHASNFFIALITAAPAISNLTAPLWSRLIHGRDRVRAVNAFQLGVLVCVAGMALAPMSELGLWQIVAFTILARCSLTGMIAARTDLWRANYPRERRARMIGVVTLLASLLVGVTALLLGRAMDIGPHAFSVVYGAAVVSGVLGVRVFARIRWRGRRAQLIAERSNGAPTSHRFDHPSAGLPAMLRLLREDRDYRRFMAAQFVLGMPNLAAIPVFIIALKDVFNLDYTGSLGLTQAAVTIVPVIVIPLWAPLLDRMHIVQYRSFHSWVWVLANGLMLLAFLWRHEPTLYVSRVVLGVATGGGMLAWELGHHDFAKRERAALYMGVHVFLTGVRGVISPFLGALLYSGIGIDAWGIANNAGAFKGIGAWAFGVFAAMSAAGALMFMSLGSDMRGQSRDA